MPPLETEEFRRGEQFARQVHAVVACFGPEDLSSTERDAMAGQMIMVATEFVKRRNRLRNATDGL